MKKTNELLTVSEDLDQENYDKLLQSGSIAVDCEMTGLNPYRDRLCLVQICDKDGKVYLVRNEQWHAAKVLKAVMADPQITKVFHFAIMDCAFILKNFDVDVKHPYCTKIASKLARTYTDEHSLASIVKELMSIEMSKNEQSTFWFAEELTSKQLAYAANDVRYLLEIRERLEAMLVRKGTLPTGITFSHLNNECQNFIPTLVHLWVNGWDFGREERSAAMIFGR